MGAAKRRASRRRASRKKRRATRKRRVTRRKRRVKKTGSRRQVFNGTRVKSVGRLVSKKASSAAKKRFKNSAISRWSKAFAQARKNLKVKGFKPCKKGSKLYKETRRIYDGK